MACFYSCWREFHPSVFLGRDIRLFVVSFHYYGLTSRTQMFKMAVANSVQDILKQILAYSILWRSFHFVLGDLTLHDWFCGLSSSRHLRGEPSTLHHHAILTSSISAKFQHSFTLPLIWSAPVLSPENYKMPLEGLVCPTLHASSVHMSELGVNSPGHLMFRN